MRYRVTEAGMVPAQASVDIVTVTVWVTLLIGVLFVVVGIRGQQRWLRFWGALTCLCCGVYFVRGLFWTIS